MLLFRTLLVSVFFILLIYGINISACFTLSLGLGKEVTAICAGTCSSSFSEDRGIYRVFASWREENSETLAWTFVWLNLAESHAPLFDQKVDWDVKTLSWETEIRKCWTLNWK